MELSSSATQRGNASDPLGIQLGSVRASTVDAANAFARHLAETSQARTARRQEDYTVGQNDRPEPRGRSPREDEVENRKASRRAQDTKNERSADDDNEADAAQAAAVPGPAALGEEEPGGTDDFTGGKPVSPDTNEPSGEAPGSEPETAHISARTPVSGMDEKAALPIADPSSGGKAAAIAGAGATASSGPAQAAAASAKAGTAGATAAINAAKTQDQPGTLVGQDPDSKPGDGIATAKPADAAPKTRTAGSGLPTELSVTGNPTEAESEIRVAIKAGSGKGLGHAAAEQLADKKSDIKQAAAQAAMQPSQIDRQTQRAANAASAPTPLASIAGTSGTSHDGGLALSGNAPAATANANTVSVRIGTLPGQSQPTQIPAATIALQMARNLQKGLSRFDIRLDPPEMGRVDVRMEVRKDGHVAAHMIVDRPETLDLLQRDARALQQALNNAGLQADSDSLNFTLRDQNADTGTPDFANGGTGGHVSEDMEDAAATPLYNVNLSINGGIDIRV
tara:strand:- start:1524 stop:3053 length:1530 start_codon:yes stop_codon:yes gene_type:complete